MSKNYIIDATKGKSEVANIFLEKPADVSGMKRMLTIPIKVMDDNGDSHKLSVKFPDMILPFGVSTFENEDKPPKHTMVMSFDSIDTNKDHQNSLEFVKALEKKIVEELYKNKDWIGRNAEDTEDVVGAFQKSIIRFSKQKREDGTDKYPPQITSKLDTYPDGNFRAKVYEYKTNNKLGNPLESIMKGGKCRSLQDMSAIWVVNGQYGIMVKGVQIKTNQLMQKDNCFFDSDDDEDV